MLVEIKCDIFREKAVKFHSGFNVVLGDEKASNSIGKSNLLLIIDFVFGGNVFTPGSVPDVFVLNLMTNINLKEIQMIQQQYLSVIKIILWVLLLPLMNLLNFCKKNIL